MLIYSVDRPTRRLPTSSFVIKKRAAVSGFDMRVGAGSPWQYLIVRLKPLLCVPRGPLAPPSTLNQSAIAMSENAFVRKDPSFRYALFFFALYPLPVRFPPEVRFCSSLFERQDLTFCARFWFLKQIPTFFYDDRRKRSKKGSTKRNRPKTIRTH